MWSLRNAVALATVCALAIVQSTQATYGVCETCNDYVLQRVCREEDVSTDQYATNSTNFNIGVLRSFTGDGSEDLSVMCAYNKALSDFYSTSSFSVGLVWLDSDSDVQGGAQAALCMNKAGVEVVAGPKTSTVAEGASMIGNIYDLNMVAAAATSPLLSDTSDYAYFSRVIPSDSYQGSLLAELAYALDWQKIATISIPTNAYFSGITDAFTDRAEELGISLTTYTLQEDFTESKIREHLEDIKSSGIRIIMAAMKPMHTTLTIASELGMLEEGWGWLTTETAISILESNIWNLNETYLENMDSLLNGVIGLVPAMDTTSTVYAEWQDCVADNFEITDTTSMYYGIGDIVNESYDNMTEALEEAQVFWNGYMYDAVYFTMKALSGLSESELTNATAVREAIHKTKVNGTSGSIKLNSDGDRIGAQYEIGNIYNLKYNVVGTVNSSNPTYDISELALVFPGNVTTIPIDYVMDCSLTDDYNQSVTDCQGKYRTVTYTQNSADSIRYCADVDPFEVKCDYALFTDASMPLVVVGFVIVVTFNVILFVRWNHKVIRLSQREFLLMMMTGAYIAFIGSLLSIGSLDDLKCASLPAFTAVGYVLMFGPLFVKSWRVSVLIRNKKLKRMKITNLSLYARIAVLLAIVIIVLIVMYIVDPPHLTTDSEPTTLSDGTIALVPFTTCSVNSNTMSLVLIFVLAMMTAYGCFVSYTIRNVSSELSEAHWIFLSVYNGAVLSIVTLAVVLGIDLNYAQLHLYATLGIVLVCIVTVSLIMIPKLINIHKNVTVASSSEGMTFGNGSMTNSKESNGITASMFERTLYPGDSSYEGTYKDGSVVETTLIRPPPMSEAVTPPPMPHTHA